MVWTNFSFQTNQVLTAAQLNNLQSNFVAVSSLDSGAPRIMPSMALAPLSVTDYTLYGVGIGINSRDLFVSSGVWSAIKVNSSGSSAGWTRMRWRTDINTWQDEIDSGMFFSTGSDTKLYSTFSQGVYLLRF